MWAGSFGGQYFHLKHCWLWGMSKVGDLGDEIAKTQVLESGQLDVPD